MTGKWFIGTWKAEMCSLWKMEWSSWEILELLEFWDSLWLKQERWLERHIICLLRLLSQNHILLKQIYGLWEWYFMRCVLKDHLLMVKIWTFSVWRSSKVGISKFLLIIQGISKISLVICYKLVNLEDQPLTKYWNRH